MIRGLYTSASGMLTQMNSMDVISNNLANVNTTGFKKDGAVIRSFPEELTKHLEPQNKMLNKVQNMGHMTLGVNVTDIYTDFRQGVMEQTNNPLDVTIQGPGFFAVRATDGQGNVVEKYTRDGAFTLNEQGALVTKTGQAVLGANNNPIILRDINEIEITDAGVIKQADVEVGRLKLVNFTDPHSLKKVGDNLLEATPLSQLDAAYQPKVLAGFLERSNVNTVQEMVDMISVMRAYEANSKAVKSHDELLGKAVNEVGKV